MKILLDAKELQTAVAKMARELVEEEGDLSKVVLVGITTRGVSLAQRISGILMDAKKTEAPVGTLDITLYRDDLSRLGYHPVVKKTEIPFSLDDKVVFLVDDVLYTGRTIRCALDALFDLGRPEAIRLAVLVDRGGKELPVQADVVGIHYEAKKEENVKVSLKETDGCDLVVVDESMK